MVVPSQEGPANCRGVEHFAEHGCCVVPGVLQPVAVAECRAGLHGDLLGLGIDHHEIERLAARAVDSGGPGGVVLPLGTRAALARAQAHQTGAIPLPFSRWRLEHCALNPELLAAHRRIWRHYAEPGSAGFGGFDSPRAGSFDPDGRCCRW